MGDFWRFWSRCDRGIWSRSRRAVDTPELL